MADSESAAEAGRVAAGVTDRLVVDQTRGECQEPERDAGAKTLDRAASRRRSTAVFAEDLRVDLSSLTARISIRLLVMAAAIRHKLARSSGPQAHRLRPLIPSGSKSIMSGYQLRWSSTHQRS